MNSIWVTWNFCHRTAEGIGPSEYHQHLLTFYFARSIHTPNWCRQNSQKYLLAYRFAWFIFYEIAKSRNKQIYKYTHTHTHTNTQAHQTQSFFISLPWIVCSPTQVFNICSGCPRIPHFANDSFEMSAQPKKEIWCFCVKLDFRSLKMCSCPLMIVRLTADSMIFVA